MSVKFHVALNIDIKQIFAPAVQKSSEPCCVLNDNVRSWPLINVLDLKLQGVGIDVHDSSHDKGAHQQEKLQAEGLI